MAIKNGKYITEYYVEIENISPLTIGDSDNEPIIDEEDNTVNIPGTTIAGAFKSFIVKNVCDPKIEKELFPYEKNKESSKVYFYDSVAKFIGYEIRPAVCINGETGANENKFERIFISRNHKFQLKIELYNDDKEMILLFEKAINSCIVALDEGNISIGSYKTLGAGIFKVNDIRIKRYNINEKKDLFKYLKDDKESKTVLIEKLKENSFNNEEVVTFILEGKFKTPVLIKGYSTLSYKDADGTPLQDIYGDYIIPGSSIKGAIENEGEKILTYFNKGELKDIIFGCSGDAKNDGSISKLVVFDSVISKDEAEEIIYNKIHIDKFTGGVSRSALMTDKTIKSNITIKAKYNKCKNEIIDKNAIALISLIFRNISVGNLSIGGGYSIGRGRILGNSLIIEDNGNVIFDGDISNNKITINKLDDYIEQLNKKEVLENEQ